MMMIIILMAISVVAHCQYFANILFWKFEKKKKHESKFVQHFVNFCFEKVLFSVLFGISFKEGTALFAGAWWVIAGHTFISHKSTITTTNLFYPRVILL